MQDNRLKQPRRSDRTESGALPAMEIRNVSFSYGKKRVLRNVSMTVPMGGITTILGANGCGKSTLFGLMTKNLTPDSGKIFLRGKNIANLNLRDYARQVSIVQQYNTAADDITVERLVAFGRTPYLRLMQEQSEEDEAAIERSMKVTDITAFRDRELSRLSGGQRQRVWIAMALAQNTKILLLDEPTTYLDIRYQIEILELVRSLNRDYGITIVMVLHDINQAISYSDRIAGMSDGRIAVCGNPQDVITRDSIELLYGIRLRVSEMDGNKYVLLPENRTDGSPGSDGDDGRDNDGEPACGEIMEDNGIEPAYGEIREDNGIKPVCSEIREDNGIEPVCGDNSGNNDGGEDDSGSAADPAAQKIARRKGVRILWITLGCVCLALGTIGVFLPILPTVPFYLAALFSFTRGSRRLYRWFVGTKLYHKHLESFVQHKGMTWRTKFTVIGTVTAVMAFGFFMMKNVPVGRIILAIVWICHIIAFFFIIKTAKPEDTDHD